MGEKIENGGEKTEEIVRGEREKEGDRFEFYSWEDLAEILKVGPTIILCAAEHVNTHTLSPQPDWKHSF